MRKVIDYKVVGDDWQASLARKVREAIAEGWQPIGGIGVRNERYDSEWVQAMVKMRKRNE
jgi:hypothetical protein